MEPDAGYPFEETTDDVDTEKFAGRGRILLPKVLSLTVDHLSSNGVYLLDNGVDFFVWVGRSADQNTVNSLFGVPSLENVDPTQVCFYFAILVVQSKCLEEYSTLHRYPSRLAVTISHLDSVQLYKHSERIQRIHL